MLLKKSNNSTSSISFTAHYTGQVWANHGLSYPTWQTNLGKALYGVLGPFEWCARKVIGTDFRTFLLQRHLLIDHLLHQAIAKHPNLQVVELACGLSPRGQRFCSQYPNLRYIETDLPAMAKRKNTLLRQQTLRSSRHYATPVDVFAEGRHSIDAVFNEHLHNNAPVLVITEGLVNYFPLAIITPVWQQLAHALQRYPAGYYLSDNYLLNEQRFVGTIGKLSQILGATARSKVSFHFTDQANIAPYFQQLGFNDTHLYSPADYYHSLSLPISRGKPLVTIIANKA